MTDILIPTTPEFVEAIAKSIARDRVINEVRDSVIEALQLPPGTELPEELMTRTFNEIWAGNSDEDEKQRQQYRGDAQAAISAINLKLLTM